MQDHTENYVTGSNNSAGHHSGLTASGDVDFATLVGSSKGGQVARDMPVGGDALDVMAWDDIVSSHMIPYSLHLIVLRSLLRLLLLSLGPLQW